MPGSSCSRSTRRPAGRTSRSLRQGEPGLGHIAPDVYQEYVKRLEEAGPDSKYSTIVTREKKPVKEVWEQQYFFIKGKEKIKAYLGETTPFYAQVNDRKVDFKTMLTKGWKVITEDGVIINRESASDIHEKYSSHKLELLMLVKTENKVE